MIEVLKKKGKLNVKFDVLTAVFMCIQVFWDMSNQYGVIRLKTWTLRFRLFSKEKYTYSVLMLVCVSTLIIILKTTDKFSISLRKSFTLAASHPKNFKFPTVNNSVVGIATRYCLDGSGIESRWG